MNATSVRCADGMMETGGTYADVVLSEYTAREFHNTYFPNISHGSFKYERRSKTS